MQTYSVSPKKVMGDEGEKKLKQFILSNKNFSRSVIFSSKRIFDSDVNHKREIDIIVLTKQKIYIIECKNWAGEIVSYNEKKDTIAYRSNPSAKMEKRENPVKLNNYKLKLLHSLINKKIAPLPMDRFVNKVIFINKHMLYPANLEESSNVITYKTLSSYFSSEETGQAFSFQKVLLTGLLKLITTEEQAAKTLESKYGDLPNFSKILRFLDKLPTWDYMTLIGDDGKKFTLSGDVRYFDNVFKSGTPINQIRNMNVECTRSLVLPVLFKYSTLNGYVKWARGMKKRQAAKVPLNYFGTILFQPAGEMSPKSYKILDVDSITLGNHKKY
ncbi:MAG: NERD domain-containing protein [Deltaproteobacteria bacterium]|nr:NERD domain-containing protein [Deltaproteobacteria bacterium]